jgi:hypothetical protein
MLSNIRRRIGSPGRLLVVLAVVASAAAVACHGGLLDVKDPNVVTPSQVGGAAGLPNQINGLVGDFQNAFEGYALYTGLFTDEFILSGTFPSRIDVDERNVTYDNGTVTDDVWSPLQVSRASADTGSTNFRADLQDPDFSDVQDQLKQGIALSDLYGGYDREFLAEFYCQAVIEDRAAAVTPAEAAQAALQKFQDAETSAQAAGMSDVEMAAVVGQARAQVYLASSPADYAAAAALVQNVPTDFTYLSEYSSNTNAQCNDVYGYTRGVCNLSLRWTVGDSLSSNRHHEKWAYLQEWENQGLLQVSPPGLKPVDVGVNAIVLQHLYDGAGSPILLASGWEAQMIIAESELRNGQTAAAQNRVNALLTDAAQANNPMLVVNPALAGPHAGVGGTTLPAMGAFAPVSFDGTLADDLPQLARARAAGLWLSGQRQGTLRRFRAGDGVDLYPAGTQGDGTSLPIPKQEVDNNPNLTTTSGC